MKKILIVNVGAAPEPQRSRYGDFEVWAKHAIVTKDNASEAASEPTLEIVYHDGISQPLPHYDTLAGVIIMGSLSMVTEKTEWMLRLSQQIVELVDREIPLLGICFGHQLIAQAMGGEVGFHPQGLEVGTININTLSTAVSDPIFSQLPQQFQAHAVHFQSVLSLPASALLLAYSNVEPHHAFRIGKCAWGVQFHPEFTTDIMMLSLEELKEHVPESYQKKMAVISDTETARQVLTLFADYCL